MPEKLLVGYNVKLFRNRFVSNRQSSEPRKSSPRGLRVGQFPSTLHKSLRLELLGICVRSGDGGRGACVVSDNFNAHDK